MMHRPLIRLWAGGLMVGLTINPPGGCRINGIIAPLAFLGHQLPWGQGHHALIALVVAGLKHNCPHPRAINSPRRGRGLLIARG